MDFADYRVVGITKSWLDVQAWKRLYHRSPRSGLGITSVLGRGLGSRNTKNTRNYQSSGFRNTKNTGKYQSSGSWNNKNFGTKIFKILSMPLHKSRVCNIDLILALLANRMKNQMLTQMIECHFIFPLTET